MESQDLVTAWGEDGLVVLTLNRPAARNTVSFDMWDAFSAALDEIQRASAVRAVIVTGAEGYFSNGGDVKTPPARGDGALRLAARLEMGQRNIARLRGLPVPTMAAVEGGAFGVGWSLALACDLVFASRAARFGAPFVDFGLVPDGGAAWLLGRQLGRRRAAELLFSGRSIDAEEASALGLVSRLVEPGQALSAASDFARAMGKGNRNAVELTKRLLHVAEESTLEATHALELAYCHSCQAGEEVPRARAAFIAAKAERKA